MQTFRVDYGQLFNRALAQFRRNWVAYLLLGLVVILTGAVSSSGAGGSGGAIGEPPTGDLPTNFDALVPFLVGALVVVALIALIGLGLTIFVAPWARGAMFLAANADALGQPISFVSAWGAAGRRYATLLGLHLVFSAPILIGAFIVAAPIIVFIAAIANAGANEPPIGLLVGVTLLFIGGVLALALVSAALHVWLEVSTLAAVAEDHGVFDAIRRGGAVLRSFLVAAVIMTIGFGIAGSFVSGAALIIGTAIAGLVGVFLSLAAGVGGGWIAFILGVVVAIILSLVLGVVLVAPFQAFRMIYWTLAYRQWTGLDPVWTAPVPAEAPPSGWSPVGPSVGPAPASLAPAIASGIIGGAAGAAAIAAVGASSPMSAPSPQETGGATPPAPPTIAALPTDRDDSVDSRSPAMDDATILAPTSRSEVVADSPLATLPGSAAPPPVDELPTMRAGDEPAPVETTVVDQPAGPAVAEDEPPTIVAPVETTVTDQLPLPATAPDEPPTIVAPVEPTVVDQPAGPAVAEDEPPTIVAPVETTVVDQPAGPAVAEDEPLTIVAPVEPTVVDQPAGPAVSEDEPPTIVAPVEPTVVDRPAPLAPDDAPTIAFPDATTFPIDAPLADRPAPHDDLDAPSPDSPTRPL